MTKKIRVRRQKFGVPRAVKQMFPHVKHVVDANESVEIEVCKADLNTAKALDPTNCALARAVKREHHADGAIIGLSTSYVITGDRAVRFATPERVQREIITFDRHHDFEPGDYYLVPKSATQKLNKETRKNRVHGTDPKRITHKAGKTQKIRVLPAGQN